MAGVSVFNPGSGVTDSAPRGMTAEQLRDLILPNGGLLLVTFEQGGKLAGRILADTIDEAIETAVKPRNEGGLELRGIAHVTFEEWKAGQA
jgi:hypothetical protein